MAQYAQAKRLPVDFLKDQGLSDMSYLGHPAVRMPYRDTDGTEPGVKFRLALQRTETTDNRMRWKSGSKTILYGIWRVEEARKAGFVWLVEGESDCQTLWFQGVPALGLPGANNWKDDRDASHFDGIFEIYVVIEPDAGGDAVQEWLKNSVIRDRVRLLQLDGAKDPSDLYLSAPGAFKERVREAMESATPWSEHRLAERSEQRKLAWTRCESIAKEPYILCRFLEDIRLLGLVGEDVPSQLVYLALTSRRLPQQVNVVLKGPSSGGKNTIIERSLEFFPDSAVHVLTGLSEHSLAYDDEPIGHRFIVIYEGAGMSGEMTSYFIRSLLSEGRLRYLTVEKTKDGLRSKLIERTGPTGLLITTTEIGLHPENETRMLSIQVNDTAEQTRRVLVALVDELKPVDLEPWIALQEWIETGSADVTVPFGRALANAIPESALAIRLRRDFGSLLNLIRSHALLHQASRDRDNRGHIVATLTDYAVVRELVADVLSQGVEATVPPTVRETVETVARLRGGGPATLSHKPATAQPLPVRRIAQELGIDKSPASRRIKQAIVLGYLRNLEDRKGRPHNITLRDPMPSDVEMLPTPEALDLLIRDGREPPTARGAVGSPATDASDSHQDNGTTAPPMPVRELLDAFNAEDITDDLRALKWIKEWNRQVLLCHH